MKKLLLIILALVLLGGPAWGATYNIGPGQTYETFTLLVATETLAGDDIVNGTLAGSTPFAEDWVVDGSGTSGHPITLQNAIIDSGGTENYGINLGNRDWILIDNLDISDFNARGVNVELSDNSIVQNSTITGQYGIYLKDSDNFTATDVISKNGSRGYSLNSTTKINSNIVITNSVISGMTMYGIRANGNVTYYTDGLTITYPTISTTVNPIQLNYVQNTTITGGTITGGQTISFFNCTTATITGVTSNETTDSGFSAYDSTGLNFTDNIVNNTTGNGIKFDDCSSVAVTGGIIDGGTKDGLFLTGSSTGVDNSTFQKMIIRNVWPASGTSYGDAITSHVHCSGNNFLFNFTTNNRNTSHAHTGDAAGFIYHNTSYNDGDLALASGRASFSLTSTGAMVVKNNLIFNNESYPIAATITGNNVTADYNGYISNLASPFMIDTVGGKTFTEWIAAVGGETHSYFIYINGSNYEVYKGDAPATKIATLTYCPVNSQGKLVNKSDNPLLNTGTWITGINDGGEADLWGKYLYRLPNIGADQGAGTPTVGQRQINTTIFR